MSSSTEPYILTISQTSYAKEELLIFVNPINDGPVIELPSQMAHLHTWHTYQDDLSRVIVSVDVVDTIEDTPVSIEGISVRDVDASESNNGYGAIIVEVKANHGTINLAGISGAFFRNSVPSSVVEASRTKHAFIDEPSGGYADVLRDCSLLV